MWIDCHFGICSLVVQVLPYSKDAKTWDGYHLCRLTATSITRVCYFSTYWENENRTELQNVDLCLWMDIGCNAKVVIILPYDPIKAHFCSFSQLYLIDYTNLRYIFFDCNNAWGKEVSLHTDWEWSRDLDKWRLAFSLKWWQKRNEGV